MTHQRSIGIIGAGPKGMYALDCLATELDQRGAADTLDVHVFEPHPDLGAGPVYDRRQPHFLRLNYANRQVDMWADAASGPSLVAWLRVHRPDFADPDDSAPRAVVGEYLRNGFDRVVARLERRACVRVHRTAATGVRRVNGSWSIASSDGDTAVDAILLSTGHASRRTRPSGLEGPNHVDAVYPVAASGLDRIPAGSSVAVRGLGLTAIDATLALTEGRGGRFDWSTSPIPHYQPSGREPSTIVAYSRTGLTMTPKPVRSTTSPPTHDDLASRCARVLRSASDPVGALGEFLDEVVAARLGAARTTWADRGHDDVVDAVRVAYGETPCSPDAALGDTWRASYPAIVEATASRAFDDHWVEFAALTRRMERIAFGPPASNAARFASLVVAGIVDLDLARNPAVSRSGDGFAIDSGSGTRRVDHHVNAVIAPPGVGHEPTELFASLLDAGLVRTTDHADGIDVDRDARAIGANGEPTPGLSVIGRMTDGATLGNDTLSRTLHDVPGRWARSTLRDLGIITEDGRARV